MGLFSKLNYKYKDPGPPAICRVPPRRVYDLDLCADLTELKQCLHSINEQGWILSGITQDSHGVYTVVFSRFAYG